MENKFIITMHQKISQANNSVFKEEQIPFESNKRSLAKTLSWRTIGTIDTILISWLITGTLVFALSIGAIELITKMVLYFLHERTWNHIAYGKKY